MSGGIVSANQLRVYNGANYVQFTAPALGGNINWILPNADGAPGQVLKTDGSGNLSWINGSAGSVTNVTTGTGLSGGVITSTGTISLANTSVAAGSYGTSISVPNFNVDAQGRLTGVVANAIPTANTTTTGLLTNTDWNIFNGKVNKAGDTMSGLLVLSADPTANLGSATKQYVDSSTATAAANYIRKDGTVAFTGPQSMGSNKLTLVADPTAAQDAATKNYADTKFITKNLPAAPAVGQDGQVLRWNNASVAWEYYAPATGTGSVTNVATGTGLSGGPITTNGTISLTSTAVAAGSYGTSTSIPAFNVDAQGRLTSASAIAIPTADTTTTGLLTSTDWNIFNGKVNKAGDTMSGLLVLSADPSNVLGAATKQYVDAVGSTAAAAYIRKDGTVAFTAAQSMGSNKLTFVTDPVSAQDAATKNYADTKILGKSGVAPAVGQDGQSLRWNNGTTAWEYYTAGSGGVGGTGTAGKIARFSAAATLTDSLVSEAGSTVTVNGQIVATLANVGAGTSFNFNGGNLQYTSAACAAFTLSNMVDGGSYSVGVKNTSGSCTFTHASDTIHYAGGASSVAITSHTIFTFLKLGTDIYVTWVTFQKCNQTRVKKDR